jgi:hypothetical protein
MPYLTFATYTRPGTKPTDESERNTRLFKAYNEKNDGKNNGQKDGKNDGQNDGKNDSKIMHGSRTFDQFYYQSLDDTEDRDSSQVVTRYADTKKNRNPDRWDILRVDQLWLWVIDKSMSSNTC